MTTDQENAAVRQIEAQPGSNPMGHTRMQIIETRYVTPNWPPGAEPVPVKFSGPWVVF